VLGSWHAVCILLVRCSSTGARAGLVQGNTASCAAGCFLVLCAKPGTDYREATCSAAGCVALHGLVNQVAGLSRLKCTFSCGGHRFIQQGLQAEGGLHQYWQRLHVCCQAATVWRACSPLPLVRTTHRSSHQPPTATCSHSGGGGAAFINWMLHPPTHPPTPGVPPPHPSTLLPVCCLNCTPDRHCPWASLAVADRARQPPRSTGCSLPLLLVVPIPALLS
jgi:hypothetical protein